MIRWVQSTGLGWIRLYDGPAEPVLAPWLPAFHVEEVRHLRAVKGIGLAEWQAVVVAKGVFPGAVVVGTYDWARRLAYLRRLWSRSSFTRRTYTRAPQDDDEADDS